MDEKKEIHNVIMESRNKLTISGVNSVDTFDESTVELDTILGGLILEGENLHVNQLNIATGELIVEGEINSITYSVINSKKQSGLISRLFK